MAFSSGALDRGSAVDIADDSEGLLGIDVADSVNAGAQSRLVIVTNQMDQSLTVDVSSPSASLSNAQKTLDPGESLTTAANVSCESPPNDLAFTVQAVSDAQLTGVLSRSTPVNTAGCSESKVSAGSIEIVDTSSVDGGGKQQAEYSLVYDIEGNKTAFETVSLELRASGSLIDTTESSAPNDTIAVTQTGNRGGTVYEVTVRVFDGNGEIESERVVVTDSADGGGTIYQDP
jgi:asparagine N-glycosylation enzyme membrane subunit Stt3